MPLETITRACCCRSCWRCRLQTIKGPALAGYPGPAEPGLNATTTTMRWSMNATCTQPRMRSVTGTPRSSTRRQIRSSWRSAITGWTKASSTYRNDLLLGRASAFQRCNGFAERNFTFAKLTDGSLSVRSMTGPQRAGPEPYPSRNASLRRKMRSVR